MTFALYSQAARLTPRTKTPPLQIMAQDLQAQTNANYAQALPIFKALFLRGKAWDKTYADAIKPLVLAQKQINKQMAENPQYLIADLTDAQLASYGLQRTPAPKK